MQSGDPLLIDLQAAAEVPAASNLDAWAAEQRVFISSTMDDMIEERKAVEDAVRSLGAQPVIFEQFGGMDSHPGDAYLGLVGSSTIYVGLLGKRYGHFSPNGYSATHAEFLKAKEDGLRICVWVDGGARAGMEGHQVSFLNEVQVFHVTGSFESPQVLCDDVTRRLKVIAGEDLSPWVRIGNLVIRGREIVDDGTEATVTSFVRNKQAIAALVGMQGRDGVRASGSGIRFAYADTARIVNVRSVTTKTTSSIGQQVTIDLASSRQQNEEGHFFAVSSANGVTLSAQELVARQLRAGLFGEGDALPNGFLRNSVDPLEMLRGRELPDEIVRPVARLLLSEWLLREGRADALTEFRLGPKRQERRKLAIGWNERRVYMNATPGSQRIEGDVLGL
jgi:hypothetical protein